MTAMTKRERILFDNLRDCRHKLQVERRVTYEFRRTRASLQKSFTKKVDELSRENEMLRSCLLRVVKERDTAKRKLKSAPSAKHPVHIRDEPPLPIGYSNSHSQISL